MTTATSRLHIMNNPTTMHAPFIFQSLHCCVILLMMNYEKHCVDFELSSTEMKILNDIACNLKFELWIEFTFTFTFKSNSTLTEFQCNWIELKSLHFLDCSILTPFAMSHTSASISKCLICDSSVLIPKKTHKSQLLGFYQIN
jgi:hypothetical protein